MEKMVSTAFELNHNQAEQHWMYLFFRLLVTKFGPTTACNDVVMENITRWHKMYVPLLTNQAYLWTKL